MKWTSDRPELGALTAEDFCRIVPAGTEVPLDARQLPKNEQDLHLFQRIAFIVPQRRVSCPDTEGT
jgi:hypothetical protein